MFIDSFIFLRLIYLHVFSIDRDKLKKLSFILSITDSKMYLHLA